MLKRVLIFHFLLLDIRILYVLSGHIDLSTEEAQYWLWSKNLDLSYYSKPPLIAYMNAISTSVFGDTEIGIRINAIVLGFLIGILMYFISKDIFKNFFENKKDLEVFAFLSSVFIAGIPSYQLASVLFLTDTPLAFFWILTVYLLWKSLENNRPVFWILTGISAGLGFLSKYSMVLILPPVLIFLFIHKREVFKNKWFYISILIASIFTLPVIIWNINHDFVTFKHVSTLEGAHVKVFSLKKSFEHLGDYILGQIGINSVFFLPFFVYAVYTGVKERKNRSIFYTWIFPVFIFLFFVYIAFKKRVEANWPAFGYVTLYILATFLIVKKNMFKRFAVAFLLSVVSIVILFYTPILDKAGIGKVLPPEKDPTKRLVGWKGLGEKVTHISQSLDKPFIIFSDTYHISSELAFYVKGHPRTYCINLGRRMNQFDLWESINKHAGEDVYGIYVTYASHIPDVVKNSFERFIKKYEYPIFYRGKEVYRIYIYILRGFKGIEEKRVNRY